MAKHTYHTCDRCGKKLQEDYKILPVIVDRRADAAGSMEDIVEELDLCQNCLVSAVFYLIESKGYSCDERQAFVRRVTGGKRP